MGEDFVIRPYSSNDLQFIEKLGQQTVDDGKVFPFRNIQGVKNYWFSKGGHVFVAVIGDKVVGSYVVKPVFPDRCSHIANAGYMVDNGYRGRGIGYLLGKHSIQQSARLGYRGMQFNVVVSTNESAITLWKRLGFTHVGTIPGAFEQDQGFVDLLIWFRDLTKGELPCKIT